MNQMNQGYDKSIESDLYERFLDFKNEVLSEMPEEQAMNVIHSYIYLLLSR